MSFSGKSQIVAEHTQDSGSRKLCLRENKWQPERTAETECGLVHPIPENDEEERPREGERKGLVIPGCGSGQREC